ncbi:glucan biosynthesis protein G [Actibacterium mucosum KCTC 23349]|uniref:Glucan biosynthesis protein G n=1 Tax=Actibacterium mucosum KCTC 23349 TaxID=1454373 RepID=A0A037ZMZ8_9RHOB|nr:glucan biosynthesis protein G [Actibacterium mucosum]KAJ56221.1 glucan biosynthesis protein G [Actibacterium mucosum KCTC 23349]
MDRRQFLSVLASAAMAPQLAGATDGEPGLMLGKGEPFSRRAIIDRARDMAKRAYAPRAEVPLAWRELSYEQYKSIWFDTRNALWADGDTPVQMDVFHPGLYFPRAVQINAVEEGQTRRVQFDMAVFDKTDQVPDLPVPTDLGYSGLRLRAELETPGIFTEYMVMQGASYFRAIGKGQNYGLSARGIAIDTAEPSGEEFPEFTEFWIERPAPGQMDTVIHALLDGPSVTGCYRFRITPGDTTVMEVEADLFARKRLTHVGLAPLTSMFLFDETNRERFSDFRPAVHDSDGLMMMNGGGEVIWRPLANPKRLQVSGFLDKDPKGFGLMQRARQLGDFADLEAHYHTRPGLWVEPQGDWGMGRVRLVEIPSDKEIYDNIVAYWRPMDPMEPGKNHRFAYRLYWGADPAPVHTLAQVLNTRMGESTFSDGHIIAIDFAAHPDLPEDLSQVVKLIRASGGVEVTEGVLQRNPETGGARLAFRFIPGDAQVVEFRAQLRLPGQALSEVWLYRWTA